MDVKMYVTQYASISVMFPTALVVAAWLWSGASKKAAFIWLCIVAAAYAVVATSKVIFKGWGFGFESMDIAVISGHAMNACLMFTVLLNLLLRQFDTRLRWPALVAGLLATWWFSVKYVGQTIHPLPEAIAGALVGSVAACVFLYKLESRPVGKIPRPALIAGLAVILICSQAPKLSAEGMLNQVATSLSGAEQAFKRPYWRELPGGRA